MEIHGFDATMTGTTDGTTAESPGEDLQWNDEIAKHAQDWADQCKFAEHNPDKNRKTEQWDWVGQNIAIGSSFTMLSLIDSWYAEKEFYNYADATCEGNHVCGHYTQLVWAETQFIGCGWTSCTRFDYLVCHYGPGGNYRGERPYKKGRLVALPKTATFGGCSDNLCKMSLS
eukprot:XP_011672029.1 PREDICTED: GLIPR1-like protein 1 [Strongylocentrotus purpuratus]